MHVDEVIMRCWWRRWLRRCRWKRNLRLYYGLLDKLDLWLSFGIVHHRLLDVLALVVVNVWLHLWALLVLDGLLHLIVDALLVLRLLVVVLQVLLFQVNVFRL